MEDTHTEVMRNMNVMKMAVVAGAAAVLAAPTAHAQAEAYTIDPVHSTIEFKIRHLMVSDVKGTFDRFTGVIQLDAGNIEASSVEVTIETASINTRNERRDGDLRSANFFEAEKYPTITFKSKKVAKHGDAWVAVGDLTMHGVTREIELPFTLTGPVAMGENSLIGVSSSAELNRKDFGINWNQTLDSGGVAASDVVRFELDIRARK